MPELPILTTNFSMIKRDKYLLVWATFLPFQAGLIAMLTVLHFNLMSTNIAGHFPRAFKELLGHNTTQGLSILSNIGIYFLGALLTAYWVTRFANNRWMMMVPYSVTFLILIIATAAPITDGFKLNLLFFTMANQNVFSAFITEGVVKPSQMTGILIDLAQNIVKWVTLKNHTLPIIKAQIVLILSFSMGLTVAFLMDNSLVFPTFFIAIAVQFIILCLLYLKRVGQ